MDAMVDATTLEIADTPSPAPAPATAPGVEAAPRGMWEILVPTVRNDGRPFRLRYHKVWDDKVIAISGGLTVLKPAQGRWVNPDGKLFKERMIPVRIIATRAEIERIVDMTMVYYDQEAVLAYRVGDEVVLKHRA